MNADDILWSAWLGARLLISRAQNAQRAALALPGMMLPLVAVGAVWFLVFYVW